MSGAHWLQSYAHLDSPIHRAPASIKLLATLVFVTGLVLIPIAHVGWMGLALALAFGLGRVARIPLSAFVGRLALAQPFALGVAVLVLFQGRGLAIFAAVMLKSTACVAAVQLLAQTTPFPDLLDVLRRARLPDVFVLALALLHRYLFVLIDESRRMRRARLARTWRTSPWQVWRSLSSVIAVSFVRSIVRAERISVAMRARGFS
jgi:cobalt/nickel transport system permease protein